MIKEIASHPMYLMKHDNYIQVYHDFISSLEREGIFVKRVAPWSNLVEISQNPDSAFNHIVIDFPKDLSNEITRCKFYNLDGWLPKLPDLSTGISCIGLSIAMPIASSYGMIFGLSLKNQDRIKWEPFCKKIYDKFVSSFNIFRCPKCGSLTFKYENWEQTESRFTEDRIGHGLNAIATVLFLGGHGAGGEWSQATKPRKKESGFKLTCTCCYHIKSVTTSVEYL